MGEKSIAKYVDTRVWLHSKTIPNYEHEHVRTPKHLMFLFLL